MKKFILFAANTPSDPTLYYVMDPMCSWCWAFQPVIDWLAAHPQRRVSLELVVGGLAPDSDQPMPAAMRTRLAAIWRQIETQTGTPFNHDFWSRNSPRRSTYPACRAVLAAEQVRAGNFNALVQAIQQAYYLEARNPSDRNLLIELAVQCGLEAEAFIAALDATACQQQLQQHLQLKQQLGVQGFPSLVLWKDSAVIALASGYTEQVELEDRLKRWGVLG